MNDTFGRDAILSKYDENIYVINTENKKLKNNNNIISILRLFIFVFFVVYFTSHFKESPQHSLYAFFLSAAIFIFFIKISSRLKDKILHLDQLLFINRKEMEAVGENYASFESGKEFIDHQHHFSSDLDVFGDGSLFQMINRTSTRSGKEQLAKWLSHPEVNKTTIQLRQEAVKELSNKLDWRQNFEAAGKNVTETLKEKDELLNWLQGEVHFYSKKHLRILGVLLPVVLVLTILLAILKVIVFWLPLLLFISQLGLVAFHLKQLNIKHAQVGKKFNIIKKYSRLLKYIEEEEFRSRFLKELKTSLVVEDKMPSHNVNNLAKIVDNIDQRLNVMAALFLNGLFLWDINYILKLEKWQLVFRDKFPGWIDVIADVDTLVSLSGFAYNNFDFTYPDIDSNSFVLEAEELGHPLLKRGDRITNDFSINGFSQIVILTGANMAGKSTFLRSIGINMLLAMVGSPVNAARFKFYPIVFYTSLQTNDSLQKHESFFYAELKKLKLIIEKYENGEEIFILLDEILKGTNSKDQHLGSESLIKKILRLNGVGIIATHDIELAGLENLYPKQVRNHCFEIKLNQEKLIFDYKIRPGYCKVMNASILMKQIGIID